MIDEKLEHALNGLEGMIPARDLRRFAGDGKIGSIMKELGWRPTRYTKLRGQACRYYVKGDVRRLIRFSSSKGRFEYVAPRENPKSQFAFSTQEKSQ